MAKKSAIAEQTAEKRSFALQLRKDGHSYERIGQLLGTQFPNQKGHEVFTAQYARKLVYDAIKNIYRDEATKLVTLELERLDDMQLEALDVLRTPHVLISAGAVIRRVLLGEDGRPVFDPNTGLPKTVDLLDDGPRLAAIDRLLKIQDRRAKLLGLDKPTKVANTDPDGKKVVPAFIIQASPEDVKL